MKSSICSVFWNLGGQQASRLLSCSILNSVGLEPGWSIYFPSCNQALEKPGSWGSDSSRFMSEKQFENDFSCKISFSLGQA